MFSFFRRIVQFSFATILLALGGCGVQTARVEEFWGNADDAADKVRAIASRVKCELSREIYNFRERDRKSPVLKNSLAFMDKWGVQIILQLSVDEKTTVTPGVSVIAPFQNAISTFAPGATVTSAQSFTGSFGGAYSNEAITTDKTVLLYSVLELDDKEFSALSCRPDPTKATLFVDSDLGIHDWLLRSLNLQEFKVNNLGRGHIDNVLSHDVKFEIVSSGNLTPTWKLVRFTGNTANPFLNGSRDRVQELIITMGQLAKVGGGLDVPGSNSSLSAQIGADLAVQLRGLRPN